MAIGDNPYSIDTDYSATTGDFAATSGRVGVAPLSTQGGRAALFKGTTGLFSLANVDSNANLQVATMTPAGGALPVFTGQASPAAASQYGTLMMGRQNAPSPTDYQPLLLDAQGALLMAGMGKPTFRATVTGVACSANKVLLSLYNAGSNFVRISAVNIYVPSQGTITATGGSVLGLSGSQSTTNYYPLFCEMYRITSHTKGASTTQLSPVACDTSDSADSLVTVYSNSTTSASAGLLHRRDALQGTATGVEFYRVICGTERNITCRPGEGVSVVCVSNGLIAANASNGTTTASVDLQFTFTISAG